MKSFRVIVQIIFLLIAWSGYAQSLPFQAEIDQFRLDDSLRPKSDGMIVFTGSSSIRIWHDIPNDFPGYPILNRGFGGSSLTHVIDRVQDVILKYHPKQVLIYCGDNDLAADSTVDGKKVFQRMKTLTQLVRKGIGHIPILIVSIKPSPSRYHLIQKVIDANKRIERYCRKQKHMAYINVFDAMMGPDQKPLPELFIADKLHMNRKGYDLWKKIIGPYLMK